MIGIELGWTLETIEAEDDEWFEMTLCVSRALSIGIENGRRGIGRKDLSSVP